VTTLKTVRLVVWAALAALAIVVAVLAVQWQSGSRPIAASAIGGPFKLVDQTGATVTEAALKGHPTALFFGYTFCPDVCPTTLYDLTVLMKDLGPEADKLKIYFVTVDPERDTPEKMAAYLQAFDPRISGLTGSRPAIDEIIKDYRVYARKVPLDDGSYTMDHTASVYLLDQDGVFTGTIDYQEKTETALAKLKRLIEKT
jgi:protein SCO1/2